MEKLLSEKEIEETYGLSRRWLQKLRCQGGGPKFLKIGKKKILYRCSDIEIFLKTHERRTTSDKGEPNNANPR